VERQLTNGLNEMQVRSRLQALAQTIDTRGWVVKGMDVNLYASPSYATPVQAPSDRLVAPATVTTQAATDVGITAMDDMLDVSNPVAQQIDQLAQASDQSHRQQVLQQLEQVRSGKPLPSGGFASDPFPERAQSYATFTPQTVQPGMPTANPAAPPSMDDQLWATQFARNNNARQQSAYGNTKVIQPGSNQPAVMPSMPMQPLPQPMAPTRTDDTAQPTQSAAPPMKEPPNAAILGLANNDDLSVATIARQANKQQPPGEDEVVVPLH
jgi:hypothetical protein